MTKEEIIETIKYCEEVSAFSKKFPEQTYQVILSALLGRGHLELQPKKQIISEEKNLGKKTNKGLAQKLNDLITEGFFDQAKTSKEIINKLKLMGYKMAVTSLPSYLIPKVRNNELERKEVLTKNGKIYGYLRKT